MNALERIESHFKMSFKEIIAKKHWTEGLSIYALSNACGVSRDAFVYSAERLGLNLKSYSQSAIDRKKHHDHWAIGLTKENSQWARNHSERMKKNNPSQNKSARRKMTRSMAKTFRKKILPQEVEFMKILESMGIKYEFQKPVSSFIMDFFINDICIEIDSTDKWGIDRKLHAQKRDAKLAALGIKTVRINKRHLKNKSFIKNVLRNNNLV